MKLIALCMAFLILFTLLTFAAVYHQLEVLSDNIDLTKLGPSQLKLKKLAIKNRRPKTKKKVRVMPISSKKNLISVELEGNHPTIDSVAPRLVEQLDHESGDKND